MSSKRRVLILGAAGRDFHDFNTYWRNQTGCEVVAFTAAQIPDIDGRVYPPELCGPNYPKGIPIESEDKLLELIEKLKVDEAVMAYSDLSHEEVMHKAAIVNAAGADFRMLGYRQTMLRSSKPVIAVCAVRTGCGKSQTSRAVTGILKEMGKRVAAGRRRRVQLDPGQPETFFPENIRPTVLSVVDRLGCGIMNAQDESSTLFSGHAGIEP